MAYVLNRYNGQELLVLEDGTIDTSTSLGLVGRNYVGYGETQNENFIFLLENFANDAPPNRPLQGQLWYNTSNGSLNVYDGTQWVFAVGIRQSAEPPSDSTTFWLKIPENSLYVWTGNSWSLVGPESAPGFGTTRARSGTLVDVQGATKPVIFLQVNNQVIGVITTEAFEIAVASYAQENLQDIPFNLESGINLRTSSVINGNVKGTATTADRLTNLRNINGIPFDGQSDITIKSSTTNKLKKGSFIVGSDFDGSTEQTWSVDASSANLIGKIVARNSEGGFAAGTITANLVGNVTGNVTANGGTSTFNIVEANSFVGATLTGTASAARQLANNPRINGVTFSGLNDVTVPAAANTLTSNSLASNVKFSSLESVGTLIELAVSDLGITLGSSGNFKIFVDQGTPTIRSTTGTLNLDLGVTGPDVSFITAARSLALGGPNSPAITGSNTCNLGIPSSKFNIVYCDNVTSSTVQTNTITSSGGTITANGNVVVSGNLTVQGSTTIVSSAELAITDKVVNIAVGSLNSAAANGAGIYVEGATASLLYASAGDKWTMNKPLDMGANNVTTTGLFQGIATTAQYADLAENYVADKKYEPGTVVEIGGAFEVTMAHEESTSIAGVVSTKPAYLMNSECKGNYVVAVALTGRVPCKVLGPVKKGDLLVSAGNGLARSSKSPKIGSVIGKALSDFTDYQGEIEVLVGRL